MHTDATESTESTGTGAAWKAFKEAFPVTLPILAGFWFVAFAYGIYMHAEGFSFWYPFLMAACIFGGSLEFVTVAMLLSPFAPFQALMVALMIQARHFFYGIAMLEKYGHMGWKKPFLIFMMCDETFALNYGKYMDGHAGALGGCIVDSGKFDWTAHAEKFPGLCTPDESYHGITYTERFGLAGAYITKATAQLMRAMGPAQSPQSAYYLALGLESLHVRMKRHCETAQKVAEFLQQNDQVAWVRYCGLPGDKYYELGQKYLPNGSCGVVSFGVKGGRAAAEDFMGRLKIAAIETHVADARTCCLHPASTTHRQLNAEELLAAGVSEELVRYSCGLEDADDLIADLDQALRG